MALVKDSGGTPRSAQWRPLPQQGRGPVVRQEKPRPEPRETFRAPRPATPAAPAAVAQKRTPERFSYPILGGLFGKDKEGFDLPEQRPAVAPAVLAAMSPNREPRTLDQATSATWGNLENEGAAGMLRAKQQGVAQQDLQTDRAAQAQSVADHYNAQARLGERARLRQEREASDRRERVKALSAAAWAAYSPEQQAAVMANADLMAAVKQDFADQSRHGTIGDDGRRVNPKLDDYQERVAALFGEGTRGSVGYKGLEYAPNTIAFLDERGLTRADLAGRNLDDLISGDALIDRKTIENLGTQAPAFDPFKTGEMTPADRRASNLRFAQALAKGQLQFQEELASQLARGDQLIQSISSQGTNAAAGSSYGARPMKDPKPRHITPETQQRLDRYLESLARADMDPEESLSVINTDLMQRGASKEEVDEVFDLMQRVTRSALQNQDQEWFPDATLQMRSPLEVAETLGSLSIKRRQRGE